MGAALVGVRFRLLGFLGLYPLHHIVFTRLLRGIAFLAVRETWEPRG